MVSLIMSFMLSKLAMESTYDGFIADTQASEQVSQMLKRQLVAGFVFAVRLVVLLDSVIGEMNIQVIQSVFTRGVCLG
jgi:hypothetical protein